MNDANLYKSPQRASPLQDDPARQKLMLDLGRLFMLGSFLIISFRFVAIPLIIWLSIRHPRRAFHLTQAVGPCLFALALLSPVDLGVPGLGFVHGREQSGIRLVRVVAGMPAHTSLVARYGEYVSTGCAGLPCLCQPSYWVVWW